MKGSPSICFFFRLIFGILFTMLFGLFLSACDHGTDPRQTGDEGIALHFSFSHLAGGEPLAFDTVAYVNAAGNRFGVSSLQYVLSDFRFYGPDGGEIFRKDTAFLIDARDAATLHPVIRGFPATHIMRFSFLFGLSPERDAGGSMPTTEAWLNFAWPEPWGGGYHFMKVEGLFLDKSDSLSGYAMHIGSLDISDEKVRMDNHFQVMSPDIHFTPVKGFDAAIDLAMDVEGWMKGDGDYDFNRFGTAVMNDTAAQALLKKNGSKGAFTGIAAEVIDDVGVI